MLSMSSAQATGSDLVALLNGSRGHGRRHLQKRVDIHGSLVRSNLSAGIYLHAFAAGQ